MKRVFEIGKVFDTREIIKQQVNYEAEVEYANEPRPEMPRYEKPRWDKATKILSPGWYNFYRQLLP